MKICITNLLSLSVILMSGILFQPGVNFDNQFKADNQFFINDSRRLRQNRQTQGIIDNQRQRDYEREVLQPLRNRKDLEILY